MGILILVDIVFLVGFLFIIIFSGYENFVLKLNIDNYEDRFVWMGKVGFLGFKMKLISVIVVIFVVEFLKVFISLNNYLMDELFWKVLIYVMFVVLGVLFVLIDYINSKIMNY